MYSKLFSGRLLLFFLLSCSKSDTYKRNPYLGEARFSITININLPAYNALKYPQNTIFIAGAGIKGIFVTSVGNDRFYAWEAACPNQAVGSCERLQCASKINDKFEICADKTAKSFIFVKCPCDETVYNLVSGGIIYSEKSGQYPLLNYAVSVAGNLITISN